MVRIQVCDTGDGKFVIFRWLSGIEAVPCQGAVHEEGPAGPSEGLTWAQDGWMASRPLPEKHNFLLPKAELKGRRFFLLPLLILSTEGQGSGKRLAGPSPNENTTPPVRCLSERERNGQGLLMER